MERRGGRGNGGRRKLMLATRVDGLVHQLELLLALLLQMLLMQISAKCLLLLLALLLLLQVMLVKVVT